MTLSPTSGIYDTKNAGSGKHVTLNGLALGTAIDATGATVFGYQLAPLSPSNTIGTIAPAPLTVTATTNTRIYDGGTGAAAVPTITAGMLFGGDSAVLSETYATRDAGTGKILNPTAAISDGNGGANYALTLVANPTGVVNQALLSVVATNASRDFVQPNPPLGGTASGLLDGDTEANIGLVYSTTATIASAPGSYPITAAIASGNYRESLIPGTLVVAPPQSATQPTTVIGSIEQAANTAQQLQKIAAANILVPGQRDLVSRIVEGFDTKLNAPRQGPLCRIAQ